MRYEVYRTWTRLWMLYRWRLVAANNEVLAHGQSYRNKADVLHVIELVKNSARLSSGHDVPVIFV